MKRKRANSNLTATVIVVIILEVLLVMITLCVFGVIIKIDIEANDIPYMPNYVRRARQSLQEPRLLPIAYENTFLYEEEMEKKRKQEEEEKAKISFETTIAKVVFRESRGEPMEGKIAVAATIVNRINSSSFPDKLEEVILEYADISNVSTFEISADCWEATRRAINGEDPLREILGGPTLFFFNPDLSDEDELEKREDIKITYQLGNHTFYSKW